MLQVMLTLLECVHKVFTKKAKTFTPTFGSVRSGRIAYREKFKLYMMQVSCIRWMQKSFCWNDAVTDVQWKQMQW